MGGHVMRGQATQYLCTIVYLTTAVTFVLQLCGRKFLMLAVQLLRTKHFLTRSMQFPNTKFSIPSLSLSLMTVTVFQKCYLWFDKN